MGKPKQVEPVKIDANYDWGSFGSADKSGVTLGATPQATVYSTQSGIRDYLNELVNPTYNSTPFNAQRELIDSGDRQLARNLTADAFGRGARGSGMQSALNRAMTERGNQLYKAMSSEDSRVNNMIDVLSGIESNYFNQANLMANNILQRQLTNAERQGIANATNTANYNAWKDNALAGGSYLGGATLGALANYLGQDNNQYDINGNVIGTRGGYGTYNPNA